MLTAVSYALLIVIIWGVYGLYSGMGYETGFSYNSMTTSWWDGFLYRSDPLRIHTNTFYHLSYLIAKVVGKDGSYVPFQLVYATLWWARGFLAFLILRRFFSREVLVCYIAGALVLVHAADGALQWVGQMNQFGFIFWMLLACYLLIEAVRTDDKIRAVILTVAACFFEQMSLFSYESQLFLLVLFPVVLLALRRPWRKLLAISAAWYVVPAVYTLLTVRKYLHSNGSTYQEAVMRKGWRIGSVLSDWWFNISSSLKFWTWIRPGLDISPRLALVAVAVVAAGGLGVWVLAGESQRGRMFAMRGRTWWVLLAAGFVAVALSFPAYLLLNSARSLWRTQFLSGLGAALVFTALLGLLSLKLQSNTAKVAVFLVGGAVDGLLRQSDSAADGRVPSQYLGAAPDSNHRDTADCA